MTDWMYVFEENLKRINARKPNTQMILDGSLINSIKEGFYDDIEKRPYNTRDLPSLGKLRIWSSYEKGSESVEVWYERHIFGRSRLLQAFGIEVSDNIGIEIKRKDNHSLFACNVRGDRAYPDRSFLSLEGDCEGLAGDFSIEHLIEALTNTYATVTKEIHNA
ncbi:hypothetical protein D6825_03170 [Candidatus Woesearchaeota archaeon]|nr:MAG: hypothetical protein D6825_03170 [Candidatus Woesearchaeota archaeon]